jgi:hypothetical protein
MEITARVQLNIPTTIYEVNLEYDTYTKATFDSYLIAVLYKNAKSKDEAFTYIDELTGDGSLNAHFKRIYEEIASFRGEQVDLILNSSLYPVTIKVTNKYRYLTSLGVSRFRKNYYRGNLINNKEFFINEMMPNDNNSNFLDVEFNALEEKIETDVYECTFTREDINVKLTNNLSIPLNNEAFGLIYHVKSPDIMRYPGEIGASITKGVWNVLTDTVIDELNKQRIYVNRDGNVVSLLNDYLVETSVIEVFNIYFYQETKYEFIRNNSSLIEEALHEAINKSWINELKTKSLINMLNVVRDDVAKEVVEYVLHRKNSKEISEVGLRLINRGYEKGWSKETLQDMKRYASNEELSNLYKIDNTLDFNLNELLLIDKNILTDDDRNKVEQYINQKDNVISEINLRLGEIINSGVREKMKQLKTKDSVYKTLNKFINERIAHSKINYDAMSLEELQKELNSIMRVYNGAYQNILERLKKDENKA